MNRRVSSARCAQVDAAAFDAPPDEEDDDDDEVDDDEDELLLDSFVPLDSFFSLDEEEDGSDAAELERLSVR